ncbi:AI-2E family transporter [Pseudofrankia sp. DC12]|uniref:AI-2E family transporter n=1 Tax=Pseudofrankia sp. DC12 TaxID=683315 RepID=UPI000A799CBA|nr:AI-2E family transporter [Pseudofrankia sp. DC12]
MRRVTRGGTAGASAPDAPEAGAGAADVPSHSSGRTKARHDGPGSPPRRIARLAERGAARLAAAREAEAAAATAPPPSEPVKPRTAERPAAVIAASPHERAERAVPVALRVSAGWSWRLLVVGAAIYVVVIAIGRIRSIVIPVVAGLLISALIVPIAHRLQRVGVPRLASAFIALFTFFIVLGGIAVGVGFNAASELPTVIDQVNNGITQVRNYLTTGPLHLSQKQITDLIDSVQHSLTANRGKVVSGVITTASVLVEVLASLLVTVFATFFFIYDGAGIWNWIVTRFPPAAEERVRGAGRVAWATLTGYIRGTVLIAFTDALGISIGLVVVGTPLVAPLALVTFFGGFIPIVGATVAGTAAVLVTLVAKGLIPAIIVLCVVLVVQQFEGHVMHPMVMRRAVNLHPLAIVISLSAGAVLAGIPGAIAAVPTVAVINRVASYLAASGKAPPEPEVDPVGAPDAV